MNCESVSEIIPRLADQSLTDPEWMVCVAHIDSCPNCRAALLGAEALLELRRRDIEAPAKGLFDQVVAISTRDAAGSDGKRRFWMGAGVGAAVAASLFALALMFGWSDGFRSDTRAAAEFVLALNEPRQMNLAFETDRQLTGATITILLSGDVEIDGYGQQHELSWTTDLDAGVNRLSLPLFANGNDGGQMVVRLSHPNSEQVFVINLRTES